MKNRLLNNGVRVVLSYFFVVLGFPPVVAQNIGGTAINQQLLGEKCAATYIEQKQIEKIGIYGTQEFFEYWVEDKKQAIDRNPYSYRTQAVKRQIPVVVHVIHNGTAIGEGANIPLSQIQAQINILNQDYGKMNPDTVNTPDEFKDEATDANIEFVLARRDPSGLPTNGVNRVAGSKTNYTPDDGALIGQLALWPPEDYMNIWVLPLEAPYLGFSSFPISELPGLDFPASTRESDGVTIDYRYFGEGGNASENSAGRTATHEIGHFLGLRHIWGDGGCDVDDFVEDTPNQSQSNNVCLTTPRITCESRDMVENFMDYTPDQCMTLFTQGQVERIDVVLNFSPRRASLVNGMALQEPQLSPNDLSLKAIIDPQDFSCSTDIIPKVSILNVGGNAITAAEVEVRLNGELVETTTFSINLAPGETGQLTFNPVSLLPTVENSFEVEIVKVNGETDPNPSNNSLQSSPKIQSQLTLPYVFSSGDFAGQWAIKNPDNALTWEQINRPIDGVQETLIYFNGYNYQTQGELDYFISPQINLDGAPDAQLVFQMAFASYPDEDFQESLLVAVSTDCGNTFELLDAPYHKNGPSLGTVENTTDQFFPDSEVQFRTELVNLAQYAGNGDIRIAFIAVNGYGNNIFIKDIEIHPSEEYRYDFKINSVLNPGPITDGSQESEVLQISNTGNLPISQFTVIRKTNDAPADTIVVQEADLPPGGNISYALSNSLREGLNRVEYDILFPNFDQNGGNSSKLVWHYIQDDSTTIVPWRQDFNDLSELSPWISLNPEKNSLSWELIRLQSGDGNQVLALNNAQKGNSYWLGSPLFDLSGTSEASIFFERASSGFGASDKIVFSVLISTDGGYSYEELWVKGNDQLNTVTGGAATDPDAIGDYVKEYIDLSAYTGEGFEKVRLAFKVEFNDGESNPIYLDNIELFLSANPDPVDPGLGNTLVFPNPATELFYTTFNLEDYENINIQIISSSGRIVHDGEYVNTLNQTYPFSASLLSPGVYIIRITGDQISETQRLIIQ